MQAKREQRQYRQDTKVWVGKYKNLNNMPHWHYDCELIRVEKGQLDVFYDGETYHSHAGDEIFIDSGRIHFLHAADPQTLVSMIIFDYDIIKLFAKDIETDSPILSESYGVGKLYTTLKQKLSARAPLYEYETALDVAALLLQVFKREKAHKMGARQENSHLFKVLLQEIDEKYEFYTLETAARFMNMNAAYFSRLFHKLMGMTFSQYLNYIKTSKAVEVLTNDSDISMTEISLRCGFSTIRNFNRIFKKFTGYTPTNIPKDFMMKDNFAALNDRAQNPTLTGSVLLESSGEEAVPPTKYDDSAMEAKQLKTNSNLVAITNSNCQHLKK